MTFGRNRSRNRKLSETFGRNRNRSRKIYNPAQNLRTVVNPTLGILLTALGHWVHKHSVGLQLRRKWTKWSPAKQTPMAAWRRADRQTKWQSLEVSVVYRKSKSLSAETESQPKVNSSVSAETETTPNTIIWQLSAPKPKPKPKFGRTPPWLQQCCKMSGLKQVWKTGF